MSGYDWLFTVVGVLFLVGAALLWRLRVVLATIGLAFLYFGLDPQMWIGFDIAFWVLALTAIVLGVIAVIYWYPNWARKFGLGVNVVMALILIGGVTNRVYRDLEYRVEPAASEFPSESTQEYNALAAKIQQIEDKLDAMVITDAELKKAVDDAINQAVADGRLATKADVQNAITQLAAKADAIVSFLNAHPNLTIDQINNAIRTWAAGAIVDTT